MLACYGPMVRTCLDAAAAAEADGHDLEVIDLRTLSPLDLDPVFDAVRRTGRLVVVAEAPSEVSVAPRSRPACRRSASTRWRRPCCG